MFYKYILIIYVHNILLFFSQPGNFSAMNANWSCLEFISNICIQIITFEKSSFKEINFGYLKKIKIIQKWNMQFKQNKKI